MTEVPSVTLANGVDMPALGLGTSPMNDGVGRGVRASGVDRHDVFVTTKFNGKTSAQIVLRWHIQLGLVPIPKTSKPARLAENIDVFDFELSSEEMDRISALDRHGEGAIDSDRSGH
jgi:diketogulonate reductase-like aldo/keto reductase